MGTVQGMTSELQPESARLVGAVRAELARRRLTGKDLVQPLGLSRNAVYARLREEKAFDTNELSNAARFMGLTLDDLMVSAELGRNIDTTVTSGIAA